MKKRNTLVQLAFSFAASDSFLFVCLRASASVFLQEIHFESDLLVVIYGGVALDVSENSIASCLPLSKMPLHAGNECSTFIESFP